MFQEILKVKKHKEDKARRFMMECKERQEQVERDLDQARKSASDFKVFRQQEKGRLFLKIKNEKVSMKKIDELNRKVAALKEEELTLFQRVDELTIALEEAKSEYELARQAYQQAYRDVQKYEELKNEMKDEERKVNELKEENEHEPELRRHSPVF